MHEMALVRNIMEVVVDEAEAADAAEVTAVHVVVGEGRDIVDDLFESLFQFLARGTVAEHARIVIEKTPYQVRCNVCGNEFHLDLFDQRSQVCTSCGAERNYKLISGNELYISKIEAVPKPKQETA